MHLSYHPIDVLLGKLESLYRKLLDMGNLLDRRLGLRWNGLLYDLLLLVFLIQVVIVTSLVFISSFLRASLSGIGRPSPLVFLRLDFLNLLLLILVATVVFDPPITPFAPIVEVWLLLRRLLLVLVLDEDVVALHALLGVSSLHLRGYLLPVLLATMLIQQLK